VFKLLGLETVAAQRLFLGLKKRVTALVGLRREY